MPVAPLAVAVAALFGFVGLGMTAAPAAAAGFTVNNLGDAADANPGNGVCETSAGNRRCTLRAALGEAAVAPGADVITVPAGTIAVGDAYEIGTDVTIAGAGSPTILDGGNSDGVLNITAGAVTIRNLIVQKGNASSAGGGLRIDGGVVEIRDVTVRDNFAFTGGGGILVSAGAQLTVRRTSIVKNRATGAFGGGIWNRGDLEVIDALVVGNDSNRTGGIRNDGNLSLLNVTVSGNTVHSPLNGVGGIGQSGFAFLNNVTVTNNTGRGNNPASFRGGGVQTYDGNTTVLKNSIISGNHGRGGPDDCSGVFTPDSRYNLLGVTTGCTLPADTSTWLLGVDPMLFPLLGLESTDTHLPRSSSSPVVNAGAPVRPGGPAADACEAADQRGIQRILCDIGAAELQVSVPPTLVVNDVGDGVDTRPGDTLCLTVDEVCSLRAAVQEANWLPGRQTIELRTGTHNLTIPPDDETAADPTAAGDLDLTDNVTIAGVSRTASIVDGNDLSRVFEVAPGVDADLLRLAVRNGTDISGGGINVVSANLTLDSVIVEGNVSQGSGGGIGTTGLGDVVTVTGSVIRNNRADFGNGGGIDVTGTAVIRDSVVQGNTASLGGGGMRLVGTAQVQAVTVRDNTTLPGPGSSGGGISASGLTLERSTLTNNASGDHGGGLFGSGTVRNSTISGNRAANAGGGVSTSGTLVLTHVTLAGNEATQAGAGLLIFGSTASLTLRNSILYDPGTQTECSAKLPTSLGNNIVRDTSCGPAATGDKRSTNPMLNALSDNGGPTLTHLPLPGSPALNAGANAGIALDQRGVPRPQSGGFDIGAVEGSGTPTSRTSCAVTATRAGPPKQQDVTMSDSDGIRSIQAVRIVNGTVKIPAFTVGTTSPVVITATKTDQTKVTTWTFQVTDMIGNVWPCD